MARQRAAEKEAVAQFQAEQIAAAQAVAPSEPLMLPAPVEDPMMAQFNRLGKSQSVAEPLPGVLPGSMGCRRIRSVACLINAEQDEHLISARVQELRRA